jgi:hypothetical protein
MKKLPIICLLVMMFTVGTAHAQQYEFAPCGTKTFTTATGITPGGTICLDIWLTGVPDDYPPAGPDTQFAGGGWLDFSFSTDDIAYVSGGRCLLDGSEGCTGPWAPPPALGAYINEPGGPGTIFYVVSNLPGAVPDVDGDLIVGTVTLENIGPNDATLDIWPGFGSTWHPIVDTDIGLGRIVISQVCYCTIDADCDDGLFCNGVETCDAPNCTCEPGTDPCPTDTTCNEDTDSCDPILTTASIPTLSEWGMIIFMTIIMGIGVVMMYRRREI